MKYNIDQIKMTEDEVEILGWYVPSNWQDKVILHLVDQNNLDVGNISLYSRKDVAKTFFHRDEDNLFGFVIHFAKELIGKVKIVLQSEYETRYICCTAFNLWCKQLGIKLRAIKRGSVYNGFTWNLDDMVLTTDTLTIIGWVLPLEQDEKVWIEVHDQNDNVVDSFVRRVARTDVDYDNKYIKKCGFCVRLKWDKKKNYNLVFKGKFIIRRINITEALIRKVQKHYLMVSGKYLSRNHKDDDYNLWYAKVKTSKKELNEQRQKVWAYKPMFSLVIPLFNTNHLYLKKLIVSLLAQTYPYFEVCFADGSKNSSLASKIKKYSKKDPRFIYQHLSANMGISKNQNQAILMSKGEYIVFADHDDELTADALYEFASRIVNDKEIDIIYSDEDKVDENGQFYEPHFKPDFNLELLHSVNYISHLTAIKRSLLDKYGLLDDKYNGAQDFELLLRLYPHARKIVHVPKILYHWRAHRNSTAGNPNSKMYAFEAGLNAVKDMWQREYPKIKIKSVEYGVALGIYQTEFCFDKEDLISVIIPNKDHIEDLDKAIRSLIDKNTWQNLEFIIVENNSCQDETFQYYEKIQKEFKNVRVIVYKGIFNYSKINNFGVKYARGKYLLLLNNDVELIAKDSLRQMVGYCQRDDVGIVGCQLRYADDTFQHAGVIIGINGIAGHAFKNFACEKDTYFNMALTCQNYSAVTAAVLMVRKEVFEAVNGLNEKFAVAFNDIDFCLRVIQYGKSVVYTPYASFYHYESKSRGSDDTPDKRQRFHAEIGLFISQWQAYLEKGDPFYNPNLTLANEDFSLKDLEHEKIGKPFYNSEQEDYFKKAMAEYEAQNEKTNYYSGL